MILDYFQLEDIGSVLVRGVREKGDIKGNAALEEAYELGSLPRKTGIAANTGIDPVVCNRYNFHCMEYADFGLFSGCKRHIMELIAAGSRQVKQLIDIKQRQPVQATTAASAGISQLPPKC